MKEPLLNVWSAGKRSGMAGLIRNSAATTVRSGITTALQNGGEPIKGGYSLNFPEIMKSLKRS